MTHYHIVCQQHADFLSKEEMQFAPFEMLYEEDNDHFPQSV